jgi:DeoR/GlpR family transcriptional regulator of sugar metabolism
MTIGEIDRPALGDERRALVSEMLLTGGAVTVSELQARFGISPMTARRDLDILATRGLARRTHGGAVLPSVAAPEHSSHQRFGTASRAKARLAAAAFNLLRAGESVFLDSSLTAYYLACRIAEQPVDVRVITNSGPVMQVLAACEDPRVKLFASGGKLRRPTGSYVGPSSVRTIRDHFADRVFLSVTEVTRDGVLTDADALEAEVKRAMLEQSAESVLLLDDLKLSGRGRQAIVAADAISLVLAHGLSAGTVAWLREAGATLRSIGTECVATTP